MLAGGSDYSSTASKWAYQFNGLLQDGTIPGLLGTTLTWANAPVYVAFQIDLCVASGPVPAPVPR